MRWRALVGALFYCAAWTTSVDVFADGTQTSCVSILSSNRSHNEVGVGAVTIVSESLAIISKLSTNFCNRVNFCNVIFSVLDPTIDDSFYQSIFNVYHFLPCTYGLKWCGNQHAWSDSDGCHDVPIWNYVKNWNVFLIPRDYLLCATQEYFGRWSSANILEYERKPNFYDVPSS